MENKKNSFIIRGNNIIGAPSVGYTELTYDQYLQMKDNDEIDLNKQYLVTCDEQTGTLLSAEDIAYNDETVKSKIDELDNTKLDKGYKSATDANDAIGEHGTNVFILSYTSENIPVRRTGIIRSFSYVQDNYIRVNQEFSTIDNSPQNGGTYKRYGSSDDGGVTYTWSGWNFVGSIDDSTTALLKTWSSSKIVDYLNSPRYTGLISGNATVDTGWSLEQKESHKFGRLLQLDGHEGQGALSYSFIVFVKANFNNATKVICKQIVGMYEDYDMEYTRFFELGISANKTLTIKNKSTVQTSYKFI